jgi:hypothetical protein
MHQRRCAASRRDHQTPHLRRSRLPHYWLLDVQRGCLAVLRLASSGYKEVLTAERDGRFRAEPLDGIELSRAALLGEDCASVCQNGPTGSFPEGE